MQQQLSRPVPKQELFPGKVLPKVPWENSRRIHHWDQGHNQFPEKTYYTPKLHLREQTFSKHANFFWQVYRPLLNTDFKWAEETCFCLRKLKFFRLKVGWMLILSLSGRKQLKYPETKSEINTACLYISINMLFDDKDLLGRTLYHLEDTK